MLQWQLNHLSHFFFKHFNSFSTKFQISSFCNNKCTFWKTISNNETQTSNTKPTHKIIFKHLEHIFKKRIIRLCTSSKNPIHPNNSLSNISRIGTINNTNSLSSAFNFNNITYTNTYITHGLCIYTNNPFISFLLQSFHNLQSYFIHGEFFHFDPLNKSFSLSQ